jgi:hypothetical protein
MSSLYFESVIFNLDFAVEFSSTNDSSSLSNQCRIKFLFVVTSGRPILIVVTVTFFLEHCFPQEANRG